MLIIIFAPDSNRQKKIKTLLKPQVDIQFCVSPDELQHTLSEPYPDSVVLDLGANETLAVLYSPKLQIALRKIPFIIGLGYPDHIKSSALRLDACVDFTNQGIAALEILLNNLKTNYDKSSTWDEAGMGYVGKSENHLKIIEQVRMICNADIHVLLTGETGTGKTVLARLIHSQSYRSDHPFMHINCASIPENLLESELFGYKKGAFTGAETSRSGKFLAAKEGTILLDEIGEISLFLQAKLLKVLDEKSLFPVGDVNAVKIKARIIAATNQNLGLAVKEKRFREDLYYRLNTIEIHIPALRERPDDIEILINHFIGQQAREIQLPLPQTESGVIEVLKEYNWPGNMRQLQNMVKALLSSRPDIISVKNLPTYLMETQNSIIHNDTQEYRSLDRIKKTYADKIYKITGYNKLKTARLLKIDVKTLRKLL